MLQEMYPRLVLRTAVIAILAMPLPVALAADQFFAGDGSALSASKWSATNAGPFDSAFVNGNVANFATVSGTGAVGSITVGGIIATEDFSVTGSGNTISNQSNGVVSIDVTSGKTLNFGSQGFTNSASAGYVKNGSGTLSLIGGNYGGGFTLNTGTVVLRGVNALGSSANASNSLILNGGTIASTTSLDLSSKYNGGITIGGNIQFGDVSGLASSTSGLTFSNNMSLGATTRTITLGNAGTMILGGVISGAGGLTIAANSNGTGAIVVSGANTYGGSTTINSGTLQLGNSNVIPNGSAIVLANVAGAKLDVNNVIETARSLSGGGAAGGNVQLGSGRLQVGDSNSTTFAGSISGSVGSSLYKFGSGTMTLSGSNTAFSGVLGLFDGTVSLGSSNALGTAKIAFLGPGTLQFSANNTTDYSATGRIFNTSMQFYRFDTNGQTVTLAGNLTSLDGSLTKLGTGTLILLGSNTYNAGTTVSSGTLEGNSSSLQGAITNNAAVTFNQSSNGTYAGNMSGSGTLTKTGNGTLTLSGANTYTGVTSVTGGTLLVDGSLANGGVEVYGGATLGGKGTIGNGAGTTVKIGATGTGTGTFAPGASIAVENIVGNLTFGSNGNFAYEINSSVSFASGADLVNVSGDISIDPAANLNFSDLATTPVLLDGSGAKYTLISYAGTLTGTFASKPNNSIVTIGSSSFYLRYNDTSPGQNFSGSTLYSKYVTITAVPEASAFLFGTVASVLACGVYLRRKAVGSRIRTAN